MLRTSGVVGHWAAAAAVVLFAALPARAQYGGMGGFGGMGAGMGAGTDTGNSSSSQSPRFMFRPWISANGSYMDSRANIANAPTYDTYGYGGSAGLSGGRAFSRTMVAGFYTATYQRYSQSLYTRGLSQVGGITVQHQASQKVSIFGSQFAGSSNGGYGYGAPAGAFGGWGTTGSSLFSDLAAGGLGFGDFASNGLVDNELYATRVHFTGTSGGVTYQPNLRWSFTGMGSASFVRRKSSGLSDLNAYNGGGQVGYRLGQFSQISAYYMAGQFSYPNMFGGNRVQQVGLGYRNKLGQLTTFSLMLGGYRFNTTQLANVSVDPTLGGLLGQGSMLSIRNMSRLGWTGTVALNRSWHNWSAGISYNHGVSPGNGAVLASDRDTVVGNASTHFGRLSLGAFAGYYRMSGILQRGLSTDNVSLGGTTGFKIADDIYCGASLGYSRFDAGVIQPQWRRFVTVHLTWSPEGAAFRF